FSIVSHPDLSLLSSLPLQPSPHPRDLHSLPTRRSSDLHCRRPHQGRDRGSAPHPQSSSPRCAFQGRRHPSRPPLSATDAIPVPGDRKSTRLNSSHVSISYAVFCLKKKTNIINFIPCITS